MKFEPIAFEHTAYLIGRRPWEVSRDSTLLVSAHLEAMKRYGLDTCIVGLDIYNAEAEAYGCKIDEPDINGVPVLRDPLFDSLNQVASLRLDPSRDGRIPMILEAAARIAKQKPDADIRIPLAGPFTIACHLFGMENMICELFTNPEATMSVLMHLAENQVVYGRAASKLGFGVAIFESSVTPPLLSPQLFSDNIVPCLRRILTSLRHIAKSGVQLIIGGDTVHIVEAMSDLQASYLICPVETDQQRFMSLVAANPDTQVRVNMKPSVFLPGNREAARAEAKRVLDIARNYPNTTVGTLLPFNADSDVVNEIAGLVETDQN